jgi:pimeloyl-ACP methyl ester carboxylesterase
MQTQAAQSIETTPCYEGGSGSPLLLLHGIGGSWHIWKPVLALLERRHKVYALTLPGHCDGPLCALQGDATVAGLADQIVQIMAERGISRAHVAGNSLGGWLSLELARRGFARSVTALSPAGGWAHVDQFRKIARKFRLFFALMPLILFLASPFLRFAGFRRFLGKESMERADRMPEHEFRHSLRAMTRSTAFLPLLRTISRDGPVRPLDPGHVPVRVAWGECDRVIPFDTYGKPIVEGLPAAQFTIVKGVGHVPMYDDPEAVAAEILAMTQAEERESGAAVGAAA